MKSVTGIALAAWLRGDVQLWAKSESARVGAPKHIPQQVATDCINAYNKADAAAIAQIYASKTQFNPASGYTANGRTAMHQESVKQEHRRWWKSELQ